MSWDWIRPKLKYVFFVLIILTIWFMISRRNDCQKKGKAKGGAYKCPLFASEPVSILPVDEYYDISKGECFHYIDYGDSMSIIPVSMDKCN